MLSDKERQELGLAVPGAGSGSAGLELRIEALIVELRGLRADLAAQQIASAPEPKAEPESRTARIREPKPEPKPESKPKSKKAGT